MLVGNALRALDGMHTSMVEAWAANAVDVQDRAWLAPAVQAFQEAGIFI